MSEHPGAPPPPPPPEQGWNTGQTPVPMSDEVYGEYDEYGRFHAYDEYVEESGWSGSAKAIVSVLTVLTLAGIAGTVWGFMRAADADGSAEVTGAEIELLTERATTAENELVELQQQTSTEIETLTAERDEAQADLDAALADQETSAAEIETLTAERDEAQTEVENLKALIEDLENPFPVIIDPDLIQVPLAGNYSALLTQVACAGFDFCAAPPPINQATISQPGGSVELNIPDFVRVTFDVVGGQLFGSTNDLPFIPPCGGAPRDAQMLINMYADDGSVAADGSLTLTGLSASVLIDASEVPGAPECPRSRVWYQLQLDRPG